MNATGQRRIFLFLRLFLSPFGRIRPPLYWTSLLALGLMGMGVSAAYGMLTLRPGFLSLISVITAGWSTLLLQTPGPGAGVSCSPGLGCHTWGSALAFEITAVFCFSAFCIQAKRLHDSGRSAIWPIVFAVFQVRAPFGLGLLSNLLFKPEDTFGFVFAVGSGMVVGLVLPVIFKLWIGLAKTRPDPNAHGPQPAPWEVALPEKPAWRGKKGS
jgi:uncharacterized membrane protein YhaH (DUF805 family)